MYREGQWEGKFVDQKTVKRKLRKSVKESSYLCEDCRTNKPRQVFVQDEIQEKKPNERIVQNL
jgi:plasmid rolling circle replication initiator protein Rep